MNELTVQSFQESLMLALTSTAMQVGNFLPRLLAAILLLILGAAVARWLKSLVVGLLAKVNLSKGLKDTPVEAFLKHSEIGRVEDMIGSVVYWIGMLIVIHATVSLLGLNVLSVVIDRLLSYIPNVVSAVLILFFGVLLAGLVESLVKGAIRSVSGQSARLLGKISSYLIVVISVMAAIAELQIAQQFIATLFTGFVAMLTIALGLAFGLGSKGVIEKFMNEWYENVRRELKD